VNSIHYIIRRIVRSPGFSFMVAITIALAVSVNLGVFSITYAILFKSMGVPDQGKLVYYTLGSGPDTRTVISGPAYEALRTNPATRETLAWRQETFHLQGPRGIVKILGAYVTGNAFSVLGIFT